MVWGGEFGARSMPGQLTETNYGRDHHPRCCDVDGPAAEESFSSAQRTTTAQRGRKPGARSRSAATICMSRGDPSGDLHGSGPPLPPTTCTPVVKDNLACNGPRKRKEFWSLPYVDDCPVLRSLRAISLRVISDFGGAAAHAGWDGRGVAIHERRRQGNSRRTWRRRTPPQLRFPRRMARWESGLRRMESRGSEAHLERGGRAYTSRSDRIFWKWDTRRCGDLLKLATSIIGERNTQAPDHHST